MAKKVVKVKLSSSLLRRTLPEQGLAAGLLLAPLSQTMARGDDSRLLQDRAAGLADAAASIPAQALEPGFQAVDSELGLAGVQQLEATPFDESLLDVLASGLEPATQEPVQAIDPDLEALSQEPLKLLADESLSSLSSAAGSETWVVAQAQAPAAAGSAGAAGGAAAGTGAAAAAAASAASIAALSPIAVAGLFVGGALVVSQVVDSEPSDTQVTDFTARLVPDSDTGDQGDNRTADRTPAFDGTAEAGATVKLTIGSREFTVKADAKGLWSITVPEDAPLAAGQYSPVFLVTDVAGNSKTFSVGDLTVELTKSLFVVDGPLKGAKVYYDKNLDGVADAGELLGETNDAGGIDVKYVPVAGAKFIIVPDEDTVDVFTGNKFDTPLQLKDSGQEGKEVVSPLTTLVASGVNEAALKQSLGIPESVELSKFNFVEVLSQGTTNTALQAAAAKVAAATVVAGNIIESTIKAAQAQAGDVSSGADLQKLTSQVSATVAKVLAALPADTPLSVATQLATKVTMASTLDSKVSADALITQIKETVSNAVAGGDQDDIAAALQQASTNVATTISTTTSATLNTLVTSTASSLGAVSTQVETLFVSVSKGSADLEDVVGLGGAFDKLEDKAEEQVNDAVNTAAGVVLKKSGLFDNEENGFQQGADQDFLEDDEYFVEGTAYTVKGNVFVDATGVPSTGVNTVGIGSLQTAVPDFVKGSASDPNAVGSTYTISTSDFGAATVNATSLLAQMGFSGVVPLTGSWTGGAYAFKATAGSAVVKTITVQAGQTLTFSYKFGSFDYLPWNDYGFLALKLQGGTSVDDGVRELVDVRDLKGPQLYKDAGVWKVNSAGQYSYTFTTGGTYTLGIGATDVGDKIFDTILTVQNLRVDGALLDGSLDSQLGNVAVNAVAPIVDVSAFVQTGNFGTLVITKSGDYFYQPGTENADDVPPGTLLEDTFTYTVKLANGFIASQNLVFTVMGEPEGQIAATSDTGVVGDGITFDDTPLLTGKSAVGSQVTVTVAGKTYETVTVGSAGTWSVQLDALQDGEYTPTIKIVNKGAEATSQGSPFTVDATPPQFINAGTNLNGSQVVLTYGQPLAAASAPASAFAVTANSQSVAVSSVQVVGSKVVLTLASPIGAGQSVLVRYTDPSNADDASAVQDVAGNDAASLTSVSVANNVQDGTPPTAPVILSLLDDVGSPQSVAASGITNDTKPTVKIQAEPGSTVAVFQGATLLGQASEIESGLFQFTPAQDLADGSVSLTAVATDKAGNPSQASAAFVFTVDATAPGVPGLALVTDSGALDGDFYSNVGDLKLTSGVQSGSVVEYSSDGGITWKPSFTAKEGQNSVLVRQTDPVGNVSTLVTPFAFTLDTAAPSMPVITSLVDNTGSTADLRTADTTPVITVTAEAGSKIVLGTSGSPLPASDYTVIESSVNPGTYTITLNKALVDGGYGLVAIDKAGNQSQLPFPGSTAGFLVDSTSPGQATITQVTDDTGSSASDRLTKDNTPVLKVTAEAGAKLVVGSGGVETTATYTVAEDSPGNYTITFTSALPDGTYGVRVIDASGNKDNTTGLAAQFTVDTTAPSAPAANIATIIQSGSDRFVTGNAQVGQGNSFSVSVGNFSSSQLGPNGFWRVDLGANSQFATSSYASEVFATDAAGNAASTSVSSPSPLPYGTSLINSTPTLGSGSALQSLPQGFEFDVGDDVGVVGTHFLGNSAPITPSVLFGDADVSVRLTSGSSADSPGDVWRLLNKADTGAALDKLVDRLESAGIDRIQLTAGDAKRLADEVETVSFDAGTDVQVLGTSFLNASAPSAPLFADLQDLLLDADTSVTLQSSDLDGILSGTDDSLDDLVGRLDAAGIDRLVLSADQASAIANSAQGFDFEAGTDINVSGTSFLTSSNPAAMNAAFGEADVKAVFTQADSDRLVKAGSDLEFDRLIDRLDTAGIDAVMIDAGQVADFAAADFTFMDGTSVVVQGTAFLNGGASGAVNDAAALFQHAGTVSVTLTTSDVERVLKGQRDLDDLMNDLEDAGVDRVSIDAGQAMALARKGLTLESDLRVSINADGEGLPDLSDGGSAQDANALKSLLQSNTRAVDVWLSNAGVREIHDGVVQAAAQPGGLAEVQTDFNNALNSFSAIGVDHLRIAPDQFLSLSAEGLNLTHAVVRLTEREVSLADFQSAEFDNLADVIDGMDDLLAVVKHHPNDSWALKIDDDLANALAEAGINTNTLESDVRVEVVAQPDIFDSDGNVAFLSSSLKDLMAAGVDNVSLASHSSVALALRDIGDAPTDSVAFIAGVSSTFFDKSANPDGHLGLVVDQDDLTALVNYFGTSANAVSQLKAKGFTDLVLAGGATVDPAGQSAAQTAQVEISTAGDIAVEFGLTSQDLVKLLGQAGDPTDPFDPFHKP